MADAAPQVGLALGGGGARGLAHIGVLRVLEEAHIPIACIAGTSIGGIIGAMWASGHHAGAMADEVRRLRRRRRMLRLVDWRPSTRGLLSGRKFYRYLNDILGAGLTFEQLNIPLAVTAVDLESWQEVQFTSGFVIDALRASMSVPGLFVPVEMDGMRLVDGGFLNNVPVDLARALGADIVLAVDIDVQPPPAGSSARLPGDSPWPNVAPPLVLDVWLAALITANAVKECKYRASPPDLLLAPPIPATVGILKGMRQLDAIIEAGAEGMRAVLPQLLKLMHDFRAQPDGDTTMVVSEDDSGHDRT